MNRYIAGLFSLLVLGAVLYAPFIAPVDASARPAAGERIASVAVRYDDLDLNRQAGVRAMYGRLQRAAADVCGDPLRAGSRFVSSTWRSCMTRTVDRAVLDVDRPLLTAYHLQQDYRGAPVPAVLLGMGH
jgi:UrcA family protein